MNISNNFIGNVQRIKNFNAELIKHLQTMKISYGKQYKKIPKIMGFQKFVKRFLGMSPQERIKYLPELKRRMIRQQIVIMQFSDNMLVHLYWSNAGPIFQKMFQQLSSVPGDRSVPLTQSLSAVGCH